MGIDELTSIHERLEKLSGADWQTIYLPIVILAAPAWLFTAWRLWRHRVGYVLYGTGAVLWVLSQALEKIQWGVPHLTEGAIYDYLTYDYLMISEEVGEMLGSMLFGLAILRAIQRSRRDRSA
jgi:hypothetical protein